MKIVFFIHTPAQVHIWRNAISVLKKDHQIMVLARDQQLTCNLLDSYGIRYSIYGAAKGSKYGKLLQLPSHFLRSLKLVRKFHPDLIIGPGLVEALVSFVLRIRIIAFWDSEVINPVELWLEKTFISVIITPSCFRKNLGRKQVFIPGYKELAYLHPNYFNPDPAIFDKLKIKHDEKYVLLRFNAFGAVHDIGRHGFNQEDKIQLVNRLQQYARIFISSEVALPEILKKYELPISNAEIHSAIYYAYLVISDTQTLTTESAVLGTAAVRCNNWVGNNDMGNFIELENTYGLIYSFNDSKKAIEKAVELIQRPDLKQEWNNKRQRLLADKIDVTKYLVDFIENYPESYQKYLEQNRQ